jgi:hypothetical protein
MIVYVIAAPRECKLLLRREDAAHSTTAAVTFLAAICCLPLSMVSDLSEAPG